MKMITNDKTDKFQEDGQSPAGEHHHDLCGDSGRDTQSRASRLTFYAELVTQTLTRIDHQLHGELEGEHPSH